MFMTKNSLKHSLIKEKAKKKKQPISLHLILCVPLSRGTGLTLTLDACEAKTQIPFQGCLQVKCEPLLSDLRRHGRCQEMGSDVKMKSRFGNVCGDDFGIRHPIKYSVPQQLKRSVRHVNSCVQ